MAYVYRHIRLDKNVPFYIGIGTTDNYKRAYDKNNRGRLWKRISQTTTYEVEIIFDEVPLDFAKKKEIEFISIYGRINDGGTLANITGGGDGWFDPPKESRAKLSERNKMNKFHFGKKHTIDAKMKIGEASKIRNSGDKNPAYKGVIEVYLKGVKIGEYNGLSQCSKSIGISKPFISECLNGRKNSKAGYTFKRIPK